MKTVSPDKEKFCIWMQAGVVRKRLCKTDYDCPACRFDRAMRKTARDNEKLRKKGIAAKGNAGQIVFWKDRLRELSVWKRPCVHHLRQRIPFRACIQDYQCSNCEFDQYFNDQYTVHAVVKPIDVQNIYGFKLPHGFYLHPGHTWLKLEEGGTVRIGIDDFIMKVLGPPDRIESPLIGKEVTQGHADITLHRGENSAQVLSPVSGVVTEINAGLRDHGDLAAKLPYSEGWIMRVHAPNLRRELKSLSIGTEAKSSLSTDIDRLYGAIEESIGPLAADGGQLCDDIYGNLPQLGWDKLTRLFLRT
jgi:glycine cleavage system H lipoate-binding protein